MSKKYIGKTCVYCAKPCSSSDGDHVISRKFFLPERREHLPIVPACKSCNNAKSKLEHYLTAVMPFGGRHTDSSAHINTMLPPRLLKNNKLAQALGIGMKSMFISQNGSPWERVMSVPIESDKLIELFKFIIKGLAYWHCKVILPPESCLVKASFFTSAGTEWFEHLLAHKAKFRVNVNLGDGVFVYEGAQSAECNELTVWRMSLYGAEVGDEQMAYAEKCTHAYGITAPNRMLAASEFMRLLGAQS